ncbi:MAG: hypothetical protein K2L98_00020 [Bacilli bacterium]|nr:hypothetical protein [Bacilli bacterium]
MSVFEPKIESPIIIRLGAKNYVLADERNQSDACIDEKEIVFLGVHYGMEIIADDGKKYKYATQRRIEKVEMKDGFLIAYEEGKSIPWKINNEGSIITRAKFDEEKDIRYVTRGLNLKAKDIPRLNAYEPVIEEVDCLITSRVSNPVVIFLNDDLKIKHPFSNIKPTIITKESEDEVDYFSTRDNTHYGFKIIGSKRSVTYPTQCPIQGVSYRQYKKSRTGRIIIHEQGKFHPWEITPNLIVKQFAYFNDFHDRDLEYLKENFGLNKKDVVKVNSYGLKYKGKK